MRLNDLGQVQSGAAAHACRRIVHGQDPNHRFRLPSEKVAFTDQIRRACGDAAISVNGRPSQNLFEAEVCRSRERSGRLQHRSRPGGW